MNVCDVFSPSFLAVEWRLQKGRYQYNALGYSWDSTEQNQELRFKKHSYGLLQSLYIFICFYFGNFKGIMVITRKKILTFIFET